jgi:endonuclease G
VDLARILADNELRNELLGVLQPRALGQRPWGIIGGGFSAGLSRDLIRSAVESPSSVLPGVDPREAIIRLFGRPVLLIRQDSIVQQTFEDPESRTWLGRLEASRPLLEACIPAVGRIEVRGHSELGWVGTGWLVAENIVVTNRHVAAEFAFRNGSTFTFRRNAEGELIRPSINFRCEYQQDEENEFRLEEVLHIEGPDGPDLALLRVRAKSALGDDLPSPIALDQEPSRPDQWVVVIGYPAQDGRRNDPVIMQHVFGGIYQVKRLAPGSILAVSDAYFTHDCTTLGGNSGSVVLDLMSGRAVGLHFGGRYGRANYAIPSKVISTILRDLNLHQ